MNNHYKKLGELWNILKQYNNPSAEWTGLEKGTLDKKSYLNGETLNNYIIAQENPPQTIYVEADISKAIKYFDGKRITDYYISCTSNKNNHMISISFIEFGPAQIGIPGVKARTN